MTLSSVIDLVFTVTIFRMVQTTILSLLSIYILSKVGSRGCSLHWRQ